MNLRQKNLLVAIGIGLMALTIYLFSVGKFFFSAGGP
ncbi:MAG: hypothetical protein RLZZ226_944 [Pseudomonadota bacterium]|jgi:hypothetical protein